MKSDGASPPKIPKLSEPGPSGDFDDLTMLKESPRDGLGSNF